MQVKVVTLSKYRLKVELTSEEAHRLLALLGPVQDDEGGSTGSIGNSPRLWGWVPRGTSSEPATPAAPPLTRST